MTGMQGSNTRINGERLVDSLMSLAEIGATPEGGCRRLALSDEDRQGRDWLVARMRGIGLDVRVDAIGNIIGILKGREPGPAVILGSHIDTVGSGGRYDGALGVVAGLEVLTTIRDLAITPACDLALIAFTGEEGARFHPDMLGSCVWSGQLSVAEALAGHDHDGAIMGEELNRIGYAGPETPGFLKAKAYIELHIEQGPVLENEKLQVAAVTGVQSITWLECTIGGVPSHAGTTPMRYRRDPGLLAGKLIVFANELTTRIPDQLANVGFIRTEPGNVNVVPEQVLMTIDLRNPDDQRLAEAEQLLRAYAVDAAEKAGLDLSFRDLARFPATPFAPEMIARVEATAEAMGLSVRRMISGAGHDAQMMSKICPTGMIFIPSIGGLSHNPKEYSTPEDIVAGANVLLHVALDTAGR